MGVLNESFNPIEGYLIKIERDTKNGWYFFEVGFPENWFYKDNDYVTTEVIKTIKDKGKIVKISPKNPDVDTDYLIEFVKKAIDINKSVNEREKHFKDEMEDFKTQFQEKIKEFEDNMLTFKEKAFDFRIKESKETSEEKITTTTTTTGSKRGRPKKTH